jgi:methyl-accepting chemotaxis protein
LFISHRISGPLYRINREVKAFKDGNLNANFNVRSNDQLQNLAKNLNEMCISLRTRHSGVKSIVKDLSDYLEDKASTLTEDERIKIQSFLEEIKQNLSFFKS